MIKLRGRKFQVDLTHKGERFRASFNTRPEAELAEAEATAAFLRGERPSIAGPAKAESLQNLRELATATYTRHWVGTKAEATSLKNAEDCVTALGEGLSPSKVDERAIDAMIASFEKKGLSGATINRKLAALSRMLNHAYSRGVIKRVPKIERRRESEHRIRWYTRDEEAKIVGYFRAVKPELATLTILLVDTGLRLGEALRLGWSDIQADNLTIWKTKGGKPKTVPLTARVKVELAKLTRTPGPVFDLTGDQCEHYWTQMRERLGYSEDPQFVIHALRHTFCSRLVQAGVPITTVKELAGHSTIQTTMRYAHLHPGNLSDAIRVLEKSA
jgi:integrase